MLKIKLNKMENTKNKTIELVITHLFEILTTETYEQTKQRVHNGKNKYRIRNKMKNWMKETSKILDNTPTKKQPLVFEKQLMDGLKNNLI
tara:strand:- start:127 stop:396 length:270 start_codon:yes stop_codon:yes gene_type:complete